MILSFPEHKLIYCHCASSGWGLSLLMLVTIGRNRLDKAWRLRIHWWHGVFWLKVRWKATRPSSKYCSLCNDIVSPNACDFCAVLSSRTNDNFCSKRFMPKVLTAAEVFRMKAGKGRFFKIAGRWGKEKAALEIVSIFLVRRLIR